MARAAGHGAGLLRFAGGAQRRKGGLMTFKGSNDGQEAGSGTSEATWPLPALYGAIFEGLAKPALNS